MGLVEKGTYNAKVLLANDTKMTTDTGQSYTINNNVIKNNNSIVSYVDNNDYLYNGNVKYPLLFFLISIVNNILSNKIILDVGMK